jgi:DNA-directed DNA polymerase III PolC
VAGADALAETAASLGYTALALTDRDGLYASVAFVQAAREHGLRPILGAELGPGPAGKEAAALGARGDSPSVLVALVRDGVGYASLCRLITMRHLDSDTALEESCARAGPGLHWVALEPRVAGALVVRRDRAAGSGDGGAVEALQSIWVGVREPGPGGHRARRAQAVARKLGLRAVAVGEVAALRQEDIELEPLLTAIRRNELYGERRTPGVNGAAPPRHLLSPEDERRRWAAFPDLLTANRELADNCRVQLTLGEPRFPNPPLEPGENAYGRLHRLCQEGLECRYGTAPRAAVRRLGEELDLIDRLGFTPYFLLVADIVGFARRHGIPTVGRGSGAGSLVTYLLGITNVDPIRYRLAFERFLHPERRDCPDLDIDLCWQRRDEVIEHVYRTYGAERVAMISTHCTLGPRGALREVARARGMPPARVDRFCRLVPRDAGDSVAAALADNPRARSLDLERGPLAELVREAERLVGLPDHLGIHPGGLVIADTALTDYTPLERATKGLVVSQYEMHAVEAVGLVKMDLLGNRALTEIGDCTALVGECTGTAPQLDPPPDGDGPTAELLTRGDTIGVFQMESPGMRNLLRMLRAQSLDDSIAAVALIRPGPSGSGMKETFVKRVRGLEPPRYLHPRLEPLLSANHGLLLYEEDVMTVAAALADWTLAEGDLFRRAIGGARTADDRAALGRAFTARLAERGVDAETAGAAWRDLARFGSYAFCKAHAAGYGVLAYQAAYLKTRWPAAFSVSLLAHHAGMYATWVLVADAQRHGVRFRLPCVNRSQIASELDGGAEPLHGPVRLGLGRVRGISSRTLARLCETRAANGSFGSLADFLGRVRPAQSELLALIGAGAFDVLGQTRATLRCEALATHGRYRGAEEEGAFRVRAAPLAVPELPEFAPHRLRELEWEALELGVLCHPCEVYAPGLSPPGEGPWGMAERRQARVAQGFTPATDLARSVGCPVRVVGIPAASRRVRTTRDDVMMFLTLDDGTALAECTFFPDAYRRAARVLSGPGPFVALGRVESQYGALTVTTERIERLTEERENYGSPASESGSTSS